jgi:quercetin dioxygenase-like cupin family protein
MGKCALQETSRVKARVQGNNGPDRKLLPTFRRIGTYDVDDYRALERLVAEQLATHAPDYNDINNPNVYEIAQSCELKTYFTSNYRQILFQTTADRPEDADIVPEEWEYQNYQESAVEFEELINQFVKPHFRARLAVIPPTEKLDWHIYTNTSYACRVSIMIHGHQKFMIKRGNKIITQIMHPGEVWFCNTGFSHRVEVIGDEPREGIVVGCLYKAIENSVPCLK